MTFEWIRPPWREEKNRPTDQNPEGSWPWVGDPFLAAVPCVHDRGKKTERSYWEYWVLCWSETSLDVYGTGDPFDAWGESDIEWIARIPRPPQG